MDQDQNTDVVAPVETPVQADPVVEAPIETPVVPVTPEVSAPVEVTPEVETPVVDPTVEVPMPDSEVTPDAVVPTVPVASMSWGPSGLTTVVPFRNQ